MAQAKKEGGLYYIGDKAVDADGQEVKGAPKKPKNTDPSKQPGALGAPTPEEKMGIAIAQALKGGTKAKASSGDEEEEQDEDTLPVLADLPAHLATLTTVEEVKALKKTDKRVGAQDAYAARLDELKS